MMKNRLLVAAVATAMVVPSAALATNGAFMHGNGTKENGRAGVGIAFHDGVLSGASNPAALVNVGNRVDFGIQIFSPDRKAEITGNDVSNVGVPATPLSQLNAGLAAQGMDQLPPGSTFSSPITAGGQPTGLTVSDMFAAQMASQQTGTQVQPVPGMGAQLPFMFNYPESDGNRNNPFYIPEMGVNYMINDGMSFGFVVVGTGGMQTNYSNLNMMGFSFSGQAESTGIQLEQVRILPTLSYKINNNHSVGASLQIAYQQFKAWGLNRFTSTGGPFEGQVSRDPSNMHDSGRDDAWGFGISLGWQGKLTDTLTIGAVYNSRIDMEELDHYAGLLAEQGDLDIAENYGIGIAFKPTDTLTLGFDIQQINYNDVDSFGRNINSGNGGLD